ncbi:MAG: S8 family serine peptidase [Anaerovoracaceae bacterium]
MRNKRKLLVIITLSFVLLIGTIYVYNNKNNDVNMQLSTAKTSASDNEVDVLMSSNKDKKEVVNKISQIKDTRKYEKAVEQYLDECYESNDIEGVGLMEESLDDRNLEIANDFRSAYNERNKKNLKFKSDQVIVSVKDSVYDKAKKELSRNRCKVTEVKNIASDTKLLLVDISNRDTVARAIKKLENNRYISQSQPNYLYRLDSTDNKRDTKNTSGLDEDWHIKKTFVNEGRNEISVPKSKVKVAVIDTGADVKHPSLRGSINVGKSIRVSDGKIGPLKGDSDTHGTHVTGILAGQKDETTGWYGVANGYIDLMVIDASTRVSGESVFGSYDLATSIDYAMNNGAKIINMSLGGFGKDKIVEEYIEACRKNDILVVCASGNENSTKYCSPSDSQSALSVINTTYQDVRYNHRIYGSNYGVDKDISAPGTNIYSTVPGNQYDVYSGTSMASPVVSGIAALVLTANPKLTYHQLKSILLSSVDDIGKPGFDVETAFGRINAQRAIKMAKNVDVTAQPVDFQVNRNKIELYRNNVTNIEYALSTLEEKASVKECSFKSDNPAVAKVDRYGNITGLNQGSAIISARIDNIEKKVNVIVKDTFSTKIVPPIYNKKIILEKNGAEGYLNQGVSKGLYYDGKANEVIDFCMASKSFDAGLFIFDSDGNIIAENDDVYYKDEDNYVADSRIRIKLPRSDRYYIQGYSTENINKNAEFEFKFMNNKVSTSLKGEKEKGNIIKLKWKKVDNVKGYKIFRCKNKYGSYEAIKKINGNTATSIKLTKQKGKYYYKIIPYNTFSKDRYYIYGGHSNLIYR